MCRSHSQTANKTSCSQAGGRSLEIWQNVSLKTNTAGFLLVSRGEVPGYAECSQCFYNLWSEQETWNLLYVRDFTNSSVITTSKKKRQAVVVWDTHQQKRVRNLNSYCQWKYLNKNTLITRDVCKLVWSPGWLVNPPK